jgi:hypothetical protein
MTTPEIERIRAALEDGPTPGEWFVCREVNDDGTVDIETGRIGQNEWSPAQNCEFPTCYYIAACNPAAMTAVLTHIDAQAQEIELLRAVIARASNVMQGGEGVEDQGEAWDRTVRILDAAMKGATP